MVILTDLLCAWQNQSQMHTPIHCRSWLFSVPSVEPTFHAHWRLLSRGFPLASRYHRETSYVYAVSHDLDAFKHRTALWACCIPLPTLGFVLFSKSRRCAAPLYSVTRPTKLHPQTRTLPFIAFPTHSALIQSRLLFVCFQSFSNSPVSLPSRC